MVAEETTFRIALAAVAAALLAAGLGGCNSGEQPDANQAPPAATVNVQPVRAATFRRTAGGVGSVWAVSDVQIAAERPGRIQKVAFTEWKAVEEGQLLYQLDGRKLQQQLQAAQAAAAEAEARLEFARADYRRLNQLRQRDAATVAEWDRAQAERRRSAAEVQRLDAETELIREQLADTKVHAPMAGRMGPTQVDEGDYVRRGTRLTTLYSSSALEARFTVPSEYLGRIERGMAVNVTASSASDANIAGRVVYVAPAIDLDTRQLPVKALIESGRDAIQPGAAISAEVTLTTRRDRPAIPAEALVATRGGYGVFVVRDGRAKFQPVQTGLRRLGVVEVIDGVRVGQSVVVHGHDRLTDGQAVRLAEGAGQPATRAATAPAEKARE